jgi:hypothetical protein
MMPNQRASTPVSPSDISNAVLEESNVEFMIAVNISVSPRNNHFYKSDDKGYDEKSYPNVI